MKLDAQAVSAGVRLATYDNIGSTNAEALSLASAGERGPLWIVARRQSAGRGRHGRTWVSEPGNLYATLLLSDPARLRHAAELSFVAALAVYDAVAIAAPGIRLALKWPNDLLGEGAKLAGILIEGEGGVVAVGIGINCRHHPGDTAYAATDLAALGAGVSAGDVFAALSRSMLIRLAQWSCGAGFAAIRADWLSRCRDVGRDISVRIGSAERRGRFEDVDASGRLLLRRADESLETISAGDVFPSLASDAAVAG